MVRRYGKDARRQRDAAWQGRVTHGRKGAAVRRCKVPVPLQMWCRVAYVQGSVHTVTFCRLACSDSLAAHLYECCYTAVAAVLQLIISCTLAGASFTNAVGQVSTSCSHTGTAAGSCRQPPPPLASMLASTVTPHVLRCLLLLPLLLLLLPSAFCLMPGAAHTQASCSLVLSIISIAAGGLAALASHLGVGLAGVCRATSVCNQG